MIAFWIALFLVMLAAIGVFVYNIKLGLKKTEEEFEGGISSELQNTEYDYGHNVKHTYKEE